MAATVRAAGMCDNPGRIMIFDIQQGARRGTAVDLMRAAADEVRADRAYNNNR